MIWSICAGLNGQPCDVHEDVDGTLLELRGQFTEPTPPPRVLWVVVKRRAA